MSDFAPQQIAAQAGARHHVLQPRAETGVALRDQDDAAGLDLIHRFQQLVDVDRLRQHPHGAMVHRLLKQLFDTVAGHHENLGFRPAACGISMKLSTPLRPGIITSMKAMSKLELT